MLDKILSGLSAFIIATISTLGYAGVVRMKLLPFTIYTLIGSYIWCLVLAYAGMKLGQHWDELAPYFHRFDAVIAILLVVGITALIYNRIKSIRAQTSAH